MSNSHHFNGAGLSPAGPRHRFHTRRRLLDALLAEVLAPADERIMEATE